MQEPKLEALLKEHQEKQKNELQLLVEKLKILLGEEISQAFDFEVCNYDPYKNEPLVVVTSKPTGLLKRELQLSESKDGIGLIVCVETTFKSYSRYDRMHLTVPTAQKLFLDWVMAEYAIVLANAKESKLGRAEQQKIKLAKQRVDNRVVKNIWRWLIPNWFRKD